MRTPYRPANRRRVLCVYPTYARSFGTFQHAYPFFGGRVRAFMPPQGLLAVAAYLPEAWDVRFVDENSRRVTDADLAWADVVFLSGMHVQRYQIHDVIRRAHPSCSVARPSRAVRSTIPTPTSCTWASWAMRPIGSSSTSIVTRVAPASRCASRPSSGCRSPRSRRPPIT